MPPPLCCSRHPNYDTILGHHNKPSISDRPDPLVRLAGGVAVEADGVDSDSEDTQIDLQRTTGARAYHSTAVSQGCGCQLMTSRSYTKCTLYIVWGIVDV